MHFLSISNLKYSIFITQVNKRRISTQLLAALESYPKRDIGPNKEQTRYESLATVKPESDKGTESEETSESESEETSESESDVDTDTETDEGADEEVYEDEASDVKVLYCISHL